MVFNRGCRYFYLVCKQQKYVSSHLGGFFFYFESINRKETDEMSTNEKGTIMQQMITPCKTYVLLVVSAIHRFVFKMSLGDALLIGCLSFFVM